MRSVLLLFPIFQTIGLRHREAGSGEEKEEAHLSLLCALNDYTVLPESEHLTFLFLGNIIHSNRLKSVPTFLWNIWQMEVPDWFINCHKERK